MRFVNQAIIILSILSLGVSCSGKSNVPAKQNSATEQSITHGVWVTVFSKEKVLYSKEAALKLVEFCKKNGINEIYLQILRSGEAYYDSRILGQTKYSKMVKEAGGDPVDFLLKEAKRNRLKVFAWINVLSLAKNQEAPILLKYGPSVLTRDKNLRSSIRTQDINDSDKFYLRDDQLFLEPGDERVVAYMSEVVEEIMARYPTFNGIHLDYIRYPYPVPFIPDSRFMDYGISYGFGEKNLARFQAETGFNPRQNDIYKDDLYLKWDRWKRDQVTNLVQKISTLVRGKSNGWRISCAVIPTEERAYSIAFQDWPLWLENGLIDYVVLMNYTRDERFSKETVKAALSLGKRDQIFVGIGIFQFKKKEEATRSYEIIKALKPKGIVFFSYEEFLDMDINIKGDNNKQ